MPVMGSSPKWTVPIRKNKHLDASKVIVQLLGKIPFYVEVLDQNQDNTVVPRKILKYLVNICLLAKKKIA